MLMLLYVYLFTFSTGIFPLLFMTYLGTLYILWDSVLNVRQLNSSAGNAPHDNDQVTVCL